MGPAATLDLFKEIISNVLASTDQDYPHIIVDCASGIPDRTKAIIYGEESPLTDLIASAKRLHNAGADFLVIACNTSHYFLNFISKAIEIPILDMIDQTAVYLKKKKIKRVVLLGTEGSKKTRIYERYLTKYDIECIYPPDSLQIKVDSLIYDCIKAGSTNFNFEHFNCLLKQVYKEFRCPFVLGCTELPIAVNEFRIEGDFINPTLIVARRAVELAGYKLRNK